MEGESVGPDRLVLQLDKVEHLGHFSKSLVSGSPTQLVRISEDQCFLFSGAEQGGVLGTLIFAN